MGSTQPVIDCNLVEKVQKYSPNADEDALNRAINFAVEHHGTQKRASGDPYYSHPVEVAEILADMYMDSTTIITALLHDTVEDTTATLDDIEQAFGAEISQLVNGVTKLTKINFQSENLRQAENFRKLLIAISEDIRVLLVKLADRLHNMRTLHFIKNPDKRQRIAHETMEVYAPLAERIGMQNVRDELQDIAFKELHPEGYHSIVSRLEFLRKSDEVVKRIETQICSLLKKEGIDADVIGREKMPYSIWRKMQKKNVSFEQLTDIIAFRITVNNVENCYRTLGVIHSHFHMVPGRFKDYISTPKANGYQSIHTVIMGPEQHRVEIQIRTEDMHAISELGIAAHWSYKQNHDYSTDGKQFRWIRELLDIIENASGAEDFLEHSKLEMYHDQVFCFSPKGDLMALPRDATPVDFAFAVHSDVGHMCVGAKVNGRIVPLRTQLKNGDQVDIITSKSQHPSPAWEKFVVTGKARSEIRKFIRSEQQREYVSLGKSIIEKIFHREKAPFNEKALTPLLEQFGKDDIEALYIAVGEGTINKFDVFKAAFPEKAKALSEKKQSLFTKLRRKKKDSAKEQYAIPIKGLIPGMAIHLAGCCHPLPGEKIVGIVNSGRGVTIHNVVCEELQKYTDSPERWIDVSWESDLHDTSYLGRLKATLNHEKGSLAELTNIIAKDEGNINNIKILHRSSDFFEILLDLEVHDVKHLSAIIASLRASRVVQSVERVSGRQN